MGAKQSSRANKEEPKLSQAEVQKLLNAQREVYEQKCQEYMEKAAADTELRYRVAQTQHANLAQNANQTQQATPTLQHMPHYMPLQHPLRQQSMQQTMPVHQQIAEFRPTRSLSAQQAMPTSNNYGPTIMNVGVVHVHARNQPSAPPLSARDRSASRSRNKNVNDALKCPVCKEMCGLQIFQCDNGHSMCKKCHEYRRSCVTCGGTSTGRRNIDLEKYVGETKVPCPHSKEGCRLYIKVADMEFHVKECSFKDLQRPTGCSWNLSHPEQRKADVDSEMRLVHPKNSQNTYIVLTGAFYFLFHVKVSNGTVYMTAQLIGTKVSASKWSYEIHVFNKNESRRKFLFTDICSSSVEPVAEIFKGGKCCILPTAYASTYVNNGALSYKFFIKQTVESKPKGDFNKNKGN